MAGDRPWNQRTATAWLGPRGRSVRARDWREGPGKTPQVFVGWLVGLGFFLLLFFCYFVFLFDCFKDLGFYPESN